MENRLKGLRSYLSGAIDRCPDGGQVYRDSITPYLEDLGVTVINPLQKPLLGHHEDQESRRKRHESKLRGDFDYVISEKSIRLVDLRLVDISDFIICCLDLKRYPCGTYEEVFTANRQKKPVLIWSPLGLIDIPDWIWWTFPKENIFKDFDAVLTYLKGIDDGSVEASKRWVFLNFDYDRLRS